eukprot:5868530-Pleurochrysis_carterae.AAC.1
MRDLHEKSATRMGGAMRDLLAKSTDDDRDALIDTYENSPQFRGVARNFARRKGGVDRSNYRKRARNTGAAVRDSSQKSAPHFR